MLRRIRDNAKKNPQWHHRTHLQNLELEWAQVFHDSLRGKPWMESLPLNIGRWAGNYSFFYVLCRLLSDYRPGRILEFGLGESSKVISTFLDNSLPASQHTIVEENPDWRDAFVDRFLLGPRSEIVVAPCCDQPLEGISYRGYQNIDQILADQKFDLYVVDGPTGSDRFSRFDIVKATQQIRAGEEFIILVDDYQRTGEQETVSRLLEEFRERGVEVHFGQYVGNATQAIVATDKYRFATTL